MGIWTKTPIKTSFKVSFKIIQEGSDFPADILLPCCRPVCGDIVLPKGNPIRPGCTVKLSWIRCLVCKKCGKKVLDETIEYCRDRARHKYSSDYGLSLINYDDTASCSMVRIKYSNRREYLGSYSEVIVRKMGKRIRSMDGDALTPASVHPSRLRERRFNQVEELARHLSGPLGIPVNISALRKERKTAPQRNLDPSGWLKNPEQVFTAAALPLVMQKVMLVDDIYTTGSTMEACARVLRKVGAEHVYFAIIFIGHGQ